MATTLEMALGGDLHPFNFIVRNKTVRDICFGYFVDFISLFRHPGVNFINIFLGNFSFESASHSFSLVAFWLCTLLAKKYWRKIGIKCWWNWPIRSISPMFYEQLLHMQITKAQKDTGDVTVFLRFWNLHT